MVVSPSQQVAFRAGFFILIGFAIIRPLSLMAHGVNIGGFGVLEFVGIGISYLLLIPLFLNLRKYRINMLDVLILIFCLYAAVSLIWGSDIRKVTQAILPFLLYFSVRMFILNNRQLNSLLIALVAGFLVPILVSTALVALDRSIEMVEYLNKLPRHSGAFLGSHVLAYVMLFFSYFYCLADRTPQLKTPKARVGMAFFLLLSIYCLYMSHTRTALIGFLIFWSIYLLGNNKKFFFVSILIIIITGFVYQDNLNRLIWKTEERDLNRATSGRVTFLINNLELFSDSSLDLKLIGRGLGYDSLYRFHNDYLSLLMSIGVVGLFVYLFMILTLLWDIYLVKDKKLKYLFGGVLISTAIMNGGSNAVINRIELSQYFWLIMGLVYRMPKILEEEYVEEKF